MRGRLAPMRSSVKQIYFINSMTSGDPVDVVKGRLKRLIGKLYYSVGITLIASIFPFNYLRKIPSHIDPKKVIVVNLGAGNHRISDDIVSLDGTDYEAVDLVADLTALPLKNNSIHCFCSCGVLEHIPDISPAVKEITRCTQRDGLSIHLIPFLFPYHELPGNYQRLTHSGVATLFGGWTMVEQRNISGPISLLLLIAIECVSTFLTLGSERVKPYACRRQACGGPNNC